MSAFKSRLQQMIAMREQDAQSPPVAVPAGASATTTYMDVVRDLVRPLRVGEVGDLSTPQREAVVALLSEVDRLRDDLETERMRLVACGEVARNGDQDMHESYRSASLNDVLDLRAARLAAEQRAARYEAALREVQAGVGEFGRSCPDHGADYQTCPHPWCVAKRAFHAGVSDAAAGTTGGNS